MKKDLKFYGIALLVLVALSLIFLLPEEVDSFTIIDKCGKFVNLLDHSIEDERQCEIRCKQQCDTKDLKYKNAEFIKAEVGCHTCTCFCKESLFGG